MKIMIIVQHVIKILQKIKNEHEVNTVTLDEIIINTVIKWRTENEERARDEKLDEKN